MIIMLIKYVKGPIDNFKLSPTGKNSFSYQ